MTYQQLWHSLTPLYDAREARAIVSTLLEELFGMTTADIICHDTDHLDSQQYETLMAMMRRLGDAEPVQYVLGEAEFCGLTFEVGPGVLIPRPETEELVAWAVESLKAKTDGQFNIADIGTGSGCIAFALKHALPQAQVNAIDISTDALEIAKHNAERLHLDVKFHQADALTNSAADVLRMFQTKGRKQGFYDLIVSNPPYICNSEAAEMNKNVLEHEPDSALFVPDTDPLLFYREIARWAKQILKPGGLLMFEINRNYGEETVQLLRNEGYAEVELRRDQFDNPRMIRATWNRY
jgi:release factor glutamine methyltransferase